MIHSKLCPKAGIVSKRTVSLHTEQTFSLRPSCVQVGAVSMLSYVCPGAWKRQ